MHDPADHPSIIHPCFASHIRGKKWLDPLPLPIVQPKKIASHRASPNHFAHSESATDSGYNAFFEFQP
jgi:hypothetical protein